MSGLRAGRRAIFNLSLPARLPAMDGPNVALITHALAATTLFSFRILRLMRPFRAASSHHIFYTDYCIIQIPILIASRYHSLMKTTLDIDDELLVKAKAVSARERKSLTALIEEGLRLRLRRVDSRRHALSHPLAIHKGNGGLAAGVDPLSNRSLLDAADDDA